MATRWQRVSTLGFAVCAASLLGTAHVSADPIPGNFWPNPTLETPSLTQPDAPAGWRRGGADFSDPPGPGPFTHTFWDAAAGTVSPTHALRVSDNNTQFGEWFTPDFGPDANIVPIPAGTEPLLRFHFHRNYSTSTITGDPADMRVTIRGHDGIASFGLGPDFDFVVNGTTNGAFESVTFDRPIPAPGGVPITGLLMNIASGGGGGVTGFLAIDEIYVARVVPEPASATAMLVAAGLLMWRRR